jgi:hypothetical protein
MLMTITILLRKGILLITLHCHLLDFARFTDDAAENAGEALGVEWALVPFAHAPQNPLFAQAIVNR